MGSGPITAALASDRNHIRKCGVCRRTRWWISCHIGVPRDFCQYSISKSLADNSKLGVIAQREAFADKGEQGINIPYQLKSTHLHGEKS